MDKASEHSSRESEAHSNLSKSERRNSARRGSLSKLGNFVLGLGGGASSGSFKTGSKVEADSVNSLTEGYRNRATAKETSEHISSEDSRSSDLNEKVNHVPITSVAQAYRGGIFLDSKLDHMKANFFEELFLEYFKSKVASESNQGQHQKNASEEFLKESKLVCSNLRQMSRLIQLMKFNQKSEEEGEDENHEGYEDSTIF